MQEVDYPIHSRVHRLRSFDTPTCQCWVKRDDELGFGISGSKFRKYRSLIPYLLSEHFEQIVLIGGIHSNNILGLSQLLVENRLPFKLYLRGDPDRLLVGNGLLTALIAGKTRIRWVSRAEWPEVEAIAKLENEGKHLFIVPEGACCLQAVEGALTLAQDIGRNEREVGLTFDHVFIDAGTGLTAIALLKGFTGTGHLHIILMAEDEEAFLGRLRAFGGSFSVPFTLYKPQNAASFGSVNERVMQEIRDVAATEGILLDPIYSAKLFIEGRRISIDTKLKGNVLFVHGGGALSLMGFKI